MNDAVSDAGPRHEANRWDDVYQRLSPKQVSWYGTGPTDATAPVRLAHLYRCPVLGLFGGNDGHIPMEGVDAFRRALEDAGVQNEIIVYPGAPHSFFDRTFADYRTACDDAWRKMLAFVGTIA